MTLGWRIEGIRNFSSNPVTGSVTIKFDPSAIDITAYLNDMACDAKIETLIRKGALHEMY